MTSQNSNQYLTLNWCERKGLFKLRKQKSIDVLLPAFLILIFAHSVHSQGATDKKEGQKILLSMNLTALHENIINQDSNNMRTGSINSSTVSFIANFRHSEKFYSNEEEASEMVNSYFRGVFHADESYLTKRLDNGLIIVTTLIGTPALGLIPLFAFTTKTSNKNTECTANNATEINRAFTRGYLNETYRIRKRDNWGCYIIISVIWFCIVGFLVH